MSLNFTTARNFGRSRGDEGIQRKAVTMVPSTRDAPPDPSADPDRTDRIRSLVEAFLANHPTDPGPVHEDAARRFIRDTDAEWDEWSKRQTQGSS